MSEDWAETHLYCSYPFCMDPIAYVEPIVAITVCSAGYTEHGLQYLPIPSDDGDYLYEPCFFCEDCWNSVLADLEELLADEPPVADEHSSFECNVCKSGIRVGELFGVATEGEMQMGARCPEGQGHPRFVGLERSTPLFICIACLNRLERDVAEMWGGRIVQHNECEAGTFMRCWRHGCPADGNCQYAHPMETANERP